MNVDERICTAGHEKSVFKDCLIAAGMNIFASKVLGSDVMG